MSSENITTSLVQKPAYFCFLKYSFLYNVLIENINFAQGAPEHVRGGAPHTLKTSDLEDLSSQP